MSRRLDRRRVLVSIAWVGAMVACGALLPYGGTLFAAVVVAVVCAGVSDVALCLRMRVPAGSTTEPATPRTHQVLAPVAGADYPGSDRWGMPRRRVPAIRHAAPGASARRRPRCPRRRQPIATAAASPALDRHAPRLRRRTRSRSRRAGSRHRLARPPPGLRTGSATAAFACTGYRSGCAHTMAVRCINGTRSPSRAPRSRRTRARAARAASVA